jgi:hypothetical protein
MVQPNIVILTISLLEFFTDAVFGALKNEMHEIFGDLFILQ